MPSVQIDLTGDDDEGDEDIHSPAASASRKDAKRLRVDQGEALGLDGRSYGRGGGHPHQQHPTYQQHHPTPSSSTSSFDARPPSVLAPSASSSQHPHYQQPSTSHPYPYASSSSSQPHPRLPPPPGYTGTNVQSAIDVDKLPTPPPPPPPQPEVSRPVFVGTLTTTALIAYPIPFLEPTVPPGQQLVREYPKGEVLLVNGQEWARIKLKYKPLPPTVKPGTEETINIIPYGASSSSTDPFGVVLAQTANELGQLLSKGLIRLEGWIARGGQSTKFSRPLYLILITIPPNITYISNALADKNLILNHPRLPWSPYWFQNCTYKNPHIENGITDAAGSRKAALIAGLGGNKGSSSRVVEQQRSQVDEVFKSLKGGDDLDETEPGPYIGAVLYPHQRKALTFLRERENEKRRPTGVRKEDFKTPSPASLWVPIESGGGGKKGKGPSKPSSWEHRVTKEVSKTKPKECRGAILADDMGLGKSLTIVSLIASTIESSQKFEIKPLECLSPTSSHSSSAPAIDPNHFSGAIFGMPTAVAPLSEKAKADEVALERHARMSRIKVKTRGTLIVCPLTTVSNWEDQLLEHWAGPVTVFTAGAGANEKGTKKNGRAEVKRKKSGKGGGGCKKGKKRRGDSSDSDSEDEPELKELRVYVYHGNYRNPDPDYLADFDVVITTFSTLATEFSKQIRTGEEGARGESTKGKGGKKKTKKQLQEEAERDEEEYEGEEESDEVMEVDENGRSEKEKAAEEDAKAAKKRKRAANKGGAVTNLAVANENEATSPLQQIEWFRVVLDEAHFIKDANTVAARAACYLEAQRRICLTGTPIQNKLDDLWALIKFIRLEPFDDKSVWAQYVSSPAKYGDSIGVARLQVIMRHITLRRTKETKLASGESLLNLPPRKDEIRYLTFSEKEAEIYQKEFEESKNDFSNMLKGEEQGAGGGTAQSSSTVGGVRGEAGGGSAPAISNTNYVNILQKILRLRQICDHYLLINDSSLSADDDLASDEPLEYEEAAAAIALSGMTQRRAGAVMTFMKEERMCECVECKVDLGCLAAPGIGGEASDKPEEEAVELGEDGKPVKKGRGRVAKKKIPQAVLTKCQHLYCLDCFKASIYAGWPKSLSGVGRSCSACSSSLRLSSDCIDVVPPPTAPAITSSEYAQPKASTSTTPSNGSTSAAAKRARAEKKRQLVEDGGEVVMSTKISYLMADLMQYSYANPWSKNYTGGATVVEVVRGGGDENKTFEAPVEEGRKMADVQGEVGESVEAVEGGGEITTFPSSNGVTQADHGVPRSNGELPAPFSSPLSSAPHSRRPTESSTTLSTPSKPPPSLTSPRLPFNPNSTSTNPDFIDPTRPTKTIVFSQWTSMLDRIESALLISAITYDRLDGTMPRDARTRAMERLKTDPACEVLLVSLRAGGVGLNLTAANRCYMMDPYWNPAVENQAVDRIHRLGQTRPVVSVKFIMQGTMEDKMLAVQQRKSELANLSLSQTMSKKELHERRMEELKTLFS